MRDTRNVKDLETGLKRLGRIYHDTRNGNATTYKHNRTGYKWTWWAKETYLEFLKRVDRDLSELK